MIIISFYLDLIISNFSFLGIPLFSLITLINLKSKKRYLVSIITGLIYDIVYSNTLILNGILFPFVVFISRKLVKYSENVFYYILLNIFYIIIYQLSIFLTFGIIKYNNFDFYELLLIIFKSLIINILYAFILKKFYLNLKNIPLNR